MEEFLIQHKNDEIGNNMAIGLVILYLILTIGIIVFMIPKIIKRQKAWKIEQNKKDSWCNVCNKPKSECSWRPESSYGGSITNHYDKHGNYTGYSHHSH